VELDRRRLGFHFDELDLRVFGPSANAMFSSGFAAAMSSVTFTFAATESVVIIWNPFALIFGNEDP